MNSIDQVIKGAEHAFFQHRQLSDKNKKLILLRFAQLITQHQQEILHANQQDLKTALHSLTPSVYARLILDEKKIEQIVASVKAVASLPDPCGKLLQRTLLDDGLTLEEITVPIGKIGIIFESRPDVIPQVLSLILKSSNVAIMKGGKEALETNLAFMTLVKKLSLEFPSLLHPSWAQLLSSRDDVSAMLDHSNRLDLVIPRGGKALIQMVMEKSKAPVLGHADGICHLYVHSDANLSMAIKIITDAKVQYPAACNAVETVLIHEQIAAQFLPRLEQELLQHKVQLRACPRSHPLLKSAVKAKDDDFGFEFSDLILAIKIVENLDQAIKHINDYGSGHTDGIMASDTNATKQFLDQVDSSSVMINASTRFADGHRYGLGAEVGISTQKTHARGPVGLEGLCIYKYHLIGNGHIVSDYAQGHRQFKHITFKQNL